MFSQQTIDPHILLGKSPYPANKFGCVGTDVAQALSDAGYPIDLNEFFREMNRLGGFTNDGLLIWGKVSEIYPYFHFHADDSGAFQFVHGLWHGHDHWLLRHDGQEFDPWYGVIGAPSGFVHSYPVNRSADIAPAEPSAPGPEPFQYTVQAGDTLTSICQLHYGIADQNEAYRKALEVAAYNHIPDPNVIQVGQAIFLP